MRRKEGRDRDTEGKKEGQEGAISLEGSRNQRPGGWGNIENVRILRRDKSKLWRGDLQCSGSAVFSCGSGSGNNVERIRILFYRLIE
jgi:hypothetical protein